MGIELGFGLMRIEDSYDSIRNCREAVEEYMKGEFCYFDVHPGYCNGKSQDIFREMIAERYPRQSYKLANKMPYYGISDYSSYHSIFRDELEKCGVEFFDYYMLHCINEENYNYHLRFDGFRFLEEMKAAGLAGRIGISFHGTPQLLSEILDRYEGLDFVQLQINFCDWGSYNIRSRDCYEIARERGKEIIVMEPIKGGSLSKNIDFEGRSITASDMADYSLRFLANLEGISIVLSGMTVPGHVISNRQSLRKERPSIDYRRLALAVNGVNQIPCTKCAYCVKECSRNINIPAVLECLNEACRTTDSLENRSGFARLYYRSIMEEIGRPSGCISCGRCEKRCPQGLPVSQFMRYAGDILESNLGGEISGQGWTALKRLSFQRKQFELQREYDTGAAFSLYIFGCGRMFHENIETVKRIGTVKGVLDSDDKKRGKNICGFDCIGIDELPDTGTTFVLIMVEGLQAAGEIERTLLGAGVKYYDIFLNWIEYAEDYCWE